MDDLAARLINWGRFLRTHPAQGRALSVEGNFRPHSDDRDDSSEPVRTRLPAPRHDDAIDVEIAVRLLPLRQHLLLKLRYVRSLHDDADLFCAWRKATGERINMRLLHEMEASALVNLRAALQLPQVIRKERALRIVKQLLRKAVVDGVDGVHQVAPNSQQTKFHRERAPQATEGVRAGIEATRVGLDRLALELLGRDASENA